MLISGSPFSLGSSTSTTASLTPFQACFWKKAWPLSSEKSSS